MSPRLASVLAVLLAALAVLLPSSAAAARPPLPSGGIELTPGQVPTVCTQAQFDAGASAYGSTYGYYYSPLKQSWLSAIACFPRWGYASMSGSGVVKAGSPITLTVNAEDGSNNTTYAPETHSISWTAPGKVTAGCGNSDLTCTVIPFAEASDVWQWAEVTVSLPRHFLVDSPGEFCGGQHLCGGVTTHAWGAVGSPPKKIGRSIKGRIIETFCSATTCRAKPLEGVSVRASGGPSAGSDVTDASGAYEIEGLKRGTYTVTPRKGSRDFDPERQVVTITTADKSSINFTTCGLNTTDGRSILGRLLAGECAEPDGVDWVMPSRMFRQDAAWNAGTGMISRSAVYPDWWNVTIFLTKDGKKMASCPKGQKWRMRVTGPKGSTVREQPGQACAATVQVSRLGDYQVRAERFVGGRWVKQYGGTVDVKDYLIVGVGDSNGSGEGNSPFEYDRCSRTKKSYQYLSAQYVEKQDPRTSVTFVFTACSGASIEHLFTEKYLGTIPNKRFPLDPQFDQVGSLISLQRGVPDQPEVQRTVDAVIMSIGVNNLAFGGIMAYCVENPHQAIPDFQVGSVEPIWCQDHHVKPSSPKGSVSFTPNAAAPTLREFLSERQRKLPARYDALTSAMRQPVRQVDSGLGIKDMSRVFAAQYPDWTHGSDGQTCDTEVSTSLLAKWDSTTWSWLGEGANELNRNVATAASKHGYQVVPIDQSAFATRGYCADDPMFLTVESGIAAGNTTGPFHPKAEAHALAAANVEPLLCRKLTGTADCTGKPK